MIKCAKPGCGYVGPQGVVVFTSTGSAEYCKLHNPRAFRDTAKDIFAGGMTLEHTRFLGEDGRPVDNKPLVVNSLQELRAAEKRHNFALACMSDSDISQPPQHDRGAGDITRGYKRKWNRDPDAYKPENITGVSSGTAQSAGDTLADHPRSLREV
jgi:hypothetical protein